jgi:hypothetical protein
MATTAARARSPRWTPHQRPTARCLGHHLSTSHSATQSRDKNETSRESLTMNRLGRITSHGGRWPLRMVLRPWRRITIGLWLLSLNWGLSHPHHGHAQPPAPLVVPERRSSQILATMAAKHYSLWIMLFAAASEDMLGEGGNGFSHGFTAKTCWLASIEILGLRDRGVGLPKFPRGSPLFSPRRRKIINIVARRASNSEARGMNWVLGSLIHHRVRQPYIQEVVRPIRSERWAMRRFLLRLGLRRASGGRRMTTGPRWSAKDPAQARGRWALCLASAEKMATPAMWPTPSDSSVQERGWHTAGVRLRPWAHLAEAQGNWAARGENQKWAGEGRISKWGWAKASNSATEASLVFLYYFLFLFFCPFLFPNFTRIQIEFK